MPIKGEFYSHGTQEWGMVMCTGDGHKVADETLASVQHSVDAPVYPLSDADLSLLDYVARHHESKTKGEHNVRVIIYERPCGPETEPEDGEEEVQQYPNGGGDM